MLYYETEYDLIYAVPARLLRKFLVYMKENKEKVTLIKKRLTADEKACAVRVLICTDGTIMGEF